MLLSVPRHSVGAAPESLRTPDHTHSFVRFMEVIRTETPVFTPALSPRRSRNMRRDEASSDHDLSMASGVVSLGVIPG